MSTGFDIGSFFAKVSFNNLVIWILSVATVVFVLDTVGLLPDRLARWLARNRLESTLKALRLLDVKLVWDEGRRPKTAPDSRSSHAVVSELDALLEQDRFDVHVDVGHRRKSWFEGFIDVMGATTQPDRAHQYARILNTEIVRLDLVFDIIATPKDGSPLLGFALAGIVRQPLVLGVCNKGTPSSDSTDGHLVLDYGKGLDLHGKTALLVDDSTTGGRKMIDLAESLEVQGVAVNAAVVLFEPVGKGAREALQAKGITLYAITKGPNQLS